MMRGYWRKLRTDLQPRKIFNDWFMQIEFTVLVLLKKCQRDKRFRDRADLIQSIGRHSSVGFGVSEAIRGNAHCPVAIGKSQCHPRRTELSHVTRDVIIKLRERRLKLGRATVTL